MKYLTSFTIGDYSRDGHGKQVTYIISSNRSCDQLHIAYFESCEKYNFDFANDLFYYWDEFCLEKSRVLSLKEIGIVFDNEEYNGYGLMEVDPYLYLNLLLQFISLSDKELEWDIKIIDSFNNNSKIGNCGYGLF